LCSHASFLSVGEGTLHRHGGGIAASRNTVYRCEELVLESADRRVKNVVSSEPVC
jgi:hypothetical protein